MVSTPMAPAEDKPGLVVRGRPRPWVMSHRGAWKHAPENSLAAFGIALEQGADMLETDLWFSADGEIVCHHDATLERMTGDPRRVADVTAHELEGVDLRGCPRGLRHGTPRLADLLELVPPPVVLMLEIKDPRFAEPARARQLAAVLGERAARRLVGVLSRDHNLLRVLAQATPGLVTGHISYANPLGSADTDLLGPYWPLLRLNPWYVARAHHRGQLVCPLDPNLHRRLGTYLKMDVDALLTDDPAETRRLIDELRRQQTARATGAPR